jgi:hypothetical protein
MSMVTARGSFLGMIVKILYPDLDTEFSITFGEVRRSFMLFCNGVYL